VQIGIVPRDLETSLRFYRDTLGFAYAGPLEVIEGRVLHRFEVDGGTLKLLEVPGQPPPERRSPPGPFQSATGIRWMTFTVEDLDGLVARLAGARWQLPVTELRPGLRVGIVEDPDGNAVELVERR